MAVITQPRSATVRRTERITPHMIRVVFGGEDLADLAIGEHADHYVKLLFPPEEPGQRPRLRSYTVRQYDPVTPEMTIDFVHHGDEGVAGPWAAAARPGDRIEFLGPGGGYAPDPTADWHLLIGDESALPAVAAALERLPSGAHARVFVEVSCEDDEQKMPTEADAEIVWLHRDSGPVGTALVRAVAELEFPPGDVQAFVHGEATFVRELRRLLIVDRGVPRDRLSISGYWRTGVDDEGWRASKPEWRRQVEQDEAEGRH